MRRRSEKKLAKWQGAFRTIRSSRLEKFNQIGLEKGDQTEMLRIGVIQASKSYNRY
jgi:hypothetical protein